LDLGYQRAAEKQLVEKGYYRLKAYLLPFRDHKRNFINGTRLEQAVALHDFDEKLRLLVFKHIQRIEVVVRNRFNELMCSKTQNAFWYLDSSLFGWNTQAYADTVNKLRSSFLDSQETFAKHFRDQYYNEYCKFYSLMPPSWMAMELMTFGNMLTLLNSISEKTIDEFKLDRWSRKDIGPDKFKKLTNWLLCIRDVRNHCAHHNRLFNRNFPAPDGIKRQLNSSIDLVPIEGSGRPQDQLNRLVLWIGAAPGVKGSHCPPHHLWWAVAAVGP
jgi:abortive infection bacteriophage resistance protein